MAGAAAKESQRLGCQGLLQNGALGILDHQRGRPKRTPHHNGKAVQEQDRHDHAGSTGNSRVTESAGSSGNSHIGVERGGRGRNNRRRSGRAPGRPAIMARLPPFFYYANALKYLASAAAAVAILNGNRAEAVTLQMSVLVLIGFKWLAVAAGLWA